MATKPLDQTIADGYALYQRVADLRVQTGTLPETPATLDANLKGTAGALKALKDTYGKRDGDQPVSVGDLLFLGRSLLNAATTLAGMSVPEGGLTLEHAAQRSQGFVFPQTVREQVSLAKQVLTLAEFSIRKINGGDGMDAFGGRDGA